MIERLNGIGGVEAVKNSGQRIRSSFPMLSSFFARLLLCQSIQGDNLCNVQRIRLLT